MGDAADRRAGEYARLEERLTQAQEDFAQALRDIRSVKAPLEQRIAELEKKLVERDVYEAEQCLPPEQAALIKHLKTVERCVDAAEDYGDDEYSNCLFCEGDRHHGHTHTCAWLALQFDRKPEATMTMVHEHALNEHETWKRRQGERNRPGLAQWLVNNIGPLPEVAALSAEDALRASMAVRESQVALARRGTEIHQNMADAMLYGTAQVAYRNEHVQALMVLPEEARPVTEVAPPDDEDVP